MRLARFHARGRHACRRALMFALLACLLPLPGSAQRPPTTETAIGLFYQPGAPSRTNLRTDAVKGEPLNLQGRVLDVNGRPVPDALVELWHADASGSVDESRFRSGQTTTKKGLFRLQTILPGHIPMARDNAVFAARHIHVVVSHPDFEQLVSLIFFKGDEALAVNPYPELAIALESAKAGTEKTLFGRVELILRRL